MALRGNNARFNVTPHRKYSGVASIAGAGAYIVPGNWNQSGRLRNFSALQPLAAVPSGHLSPSAWILPLTGGEMSSRNEAGLSLAATGAGAMGVNGSGLASLTISFALASGELIVSGAGAASFSITATGSAVATLNGTGSASFAINGAGTIGALAYGTGEATMTFNGTLVPYARGFMSGSTDVASELTNDSVAAAVWSAIATTFNVSGTMGAKLNAASAGGVDYNALAAAILAAAAADPIASNVKQVNDIDIDGTGTTGDPWGPV